MVSIRARSDRLKTAVGHLNQPFLGPRQVRPAAVAHQGGVDVHLAHVVDDDRDPQPVAVRQDVVQQGRLAGSEEAGQDGDGQGLELGHDGAPRLLRRA